MLKTVLIIKRTVNCYKMEKCTKCERKYSWNILRLIFSELIFDAKIFVAQKKSQTLCGIYPVWYNISSGECSNVYIEENRMFYTNGHNTRENKIKIMYLITWLIKITFILHFLHLNLNKGVRKRVILVFDCESLSSLILFLWLCSV